MLPLRWPRQRVTGDGVYGFGRPLLGAGGGKQQSVYSWSGRKGCWGRGGWAVGTYIYVGRNVSTPEGGCCAGLLLVGKVCLQVCILLRAASGAAQTQGWVAGAYLLWAITALFSTTLCSCREASTALLALAPACAYGRIDSTMYSLPRLATCRHLEVEAQCCAGAGNPTAPAGKSSPPPSPLPCHALQRPPSLATPARTAPAMLLLRQVLRAAPAPAAHCGPPPMRLAVPLPHKVRCCCAV